MVHCAVKVTVGLSLGKGVSGLWPMMLFCAGTKMLLYSMSFHKCSDAQQLGAVLTFHDVMLVSEVLESNANLTAVLAFPLSLLPVV